MAVTLTPVWAPGTTVGACHCATFTGAGDAGDHGVDSAATAHNLQPMATIGVPMEYSVVDTTANASVASDVWAIHSVNAATFVLRKTSVTAQNRTCLVTIKLPHSIDL